MQQTRRPAEGQLCGRCGRAAVVVLILDEEDHPVCVWHDVELSRPSIRVLRRAEGEEREWARRFGWADEL